MDGSRRTHLEKQLERSSGIHTGQNTAGNVRSLVANHVTEFKNFNFWTLTFLSSSQLGEFKSVVVSSSQLHVTRG